MNPNLKLFWFYFDDGDHPHLASLSVIDVVVEVVGIN